MVAGLRKMDHRGRNEYPASTDNWSASRLIFHFNSLPAAHCIGDVPNLEKKIRWAHQNSNLEPQHYECSALTD
jgi:hypothetical protein